MDPLSFNHRSLFDTLPLCRLPTQHWRPMRTRIHALTHFILRPTALPSCTTIAQGLQRLCGQGEVQLPQGRSLQLLTPEEAMDPSNSNHRSLEHMVAVLGDAYGPYVYRHVSNGPLRHIVTIGLRKNTVAVLGCLWGDCVPPRE